jgi:hypothetical protein
MNSKWPTLIVTLSLASGWACSPEADSQPTPVNKFGSGAGGGGTAGAATFPAQAGESGATGLGGSQPGNGGAGAAAASALAAAGNGGTPMGEAGNGASGEGGDTVGEGGSAGSAGEGGSAGQASGSVVGANCNGCSMMELKTPAWTVAGALMTAAPVGSPESGTDAYYEWLGTLLSPNHESIDGLYGPGIPHAPPYDEEPFQLLTIAGGKPQQNFTEAEFGGLNGVALLISVVPRVTAPSGSSADFDSGPIMPNDLFPLYIDGDLYRNGVIYDAVFDGFYQGYDALSTPIEKDGPSHLIIPFGENSSYFPEVQAQGHYVFRISIVDSLEEGWVIDVPFTVQ